MFKKILFLCLFFTTYLFANEMSVFQEIAQSIKESEYRDWFEWGTKMGAFFLFMFAIHEVFVSDNQSKTSQQKFWTGVFMVAGAVVLSNILKILESL